MITIGLSLITFDKILQKMRHENAEMPGKVFQVKELNSQYVAELEKHGIFKEVHTTHFRNRLLQNVDNLCEKIHGGKSAVF